jgi:hypothetical protein
MTMAWSIDDFHLAPDGDQWAARILNPGKAKEVTPPMSPSTQGIEETLGINVLPGEISIVAENDNRKLRKKLHQIMGEYQESMQKAEELEKRNRILAEGFEKVARQRVAEIETRMVQLTTNMIEISEKFEDTRKGNGIAMLNRFSAALEKATKVLEICKRSMAEKTIFNLLSIS